MKRTLTITALAIAALIVFGLIAVTAFGRHGTPPKPAAPPAPNAVPPTANAAPVQQGAPPPSFPVINMSQLIWVSYDGYRLPVSAAAGPRNMTNGLASGYADTPAGALIAAINIAARASWQFGPAIFEPVIDNQVIGQYQPDMLSADLAAWNAGGQQPPRVSVRSWLAGFAWQEYTPTVATLDLVEAAGTTEYAATQVQVQWGGGDWKLVAPPGGDWGNASTQITSLSGYTPLAGQGG